MNRRKFVFATLGSAVVLPLASKGSAAPGGRYSRDEIEQLRTQWEQWLGSGHGLDLSLTEVKRERAEWRQLLSEPAYEVLRKDGTERAGSHPYNVEERDGIYACAGCELPLFTSAMKYESGTGWPSFFTHIPGHLETKKDFKLIWPRTEYHCVRCEGHQGHVFDDGPKPTGERWCNNGVALKFFPRDS